MKYTVRQVTATGKSDPTYGEEYIVSFNEDQRNVTVSRKSPVEVGQEFNGTITESKWGVKFKKDPFVPGQSQTQSPPVATLNASAENTYVPEPRTNPGDGARQGMCINNAANYINTHENPETPQAWAERVHLAASALYSLGELEVKEESLLDSVAAVFPQ